MPNSRAMSGGTLPGPHSLAKKPPMKKAAPLKRKGLSTKTSDEKEAPLVILGFYAKTKYSSYA
jgi:hypothetical protein